MRLSGININIVCHILILDLPHWAFKGNSLIISLLIAPLLSLHLDDKVKNNIAINYSC